MAAKLTPLEIMQKLVSFPTVSRDTNLPLVDWVQEVSVVPRHRKPPLDRSRISPTRPPSLPMPARAKKGAVVLSGHTDVVPVDGQPWDTDPFTVVEKDGKYFGRGTCDMKGFDALAIWALVEAQEQGRQTPAAAGAELSTRKPAAQARRR